jgi:hypothetical protein
VCHWSFFLPTLYCICERSGTIEKEKGGIETDRYVCVGRSLRDFESFGAEGEVKEIQGERPPIGMLMSKTSPTWALSRSLACVLCMWCYLTIFLLRLLCVVVDKRQQEKREGKKKSFAWETFIARIFLSLTEKKYPWLVLSLFFFFFFFGFDSSRNPWAKDIFWGVCFHM